MNNGDKVVYKLNNMMSVKEIHTIDEKIEIAIISLFTQVVKEELEYKKTIAELFIPKAGERLEAIREYTKWARKIEILREKGRLTKEKASNSISENVLFKDTAEEKFFKLIYLL